MPMIDVNNIIIGSRHRSIDNSKVDSLMQSIKETGLINPIILNGSTLVAGAHRLEAYKRLGMNHIAYSHMGDNSNPESMELIEIDENLIRNELTPLQKVAHMTRRTEIIANRNIANEIVKVASKPKNKNGEPTLVPNSVNELLTKVEDFRPRGENKPLLNKTQQKVLKTATSNAETKAKEELKKVLSSNGDDKDVKAISRDIATYRQVTSAELDTEDLNKLTSKQLRKVATTATKQGKEAAEHEIDVALKRVEKPKADKVKADVSVLRSARALTKAHVKNDMLDSGIKKGYAKIAEGALSLYLNELSPSLENKPNYNGLMELMGDILELIKEEKQPLSDVEKMYFGDVNETHAVLTDHLNK